MSFIPDSDTNNQAYLFARNKLNGADAVETWDAAFSQWFLNACTAGTTLVTNSGSASAPNGSIASAVAAANSALSGKRSF